MKFKKKIEMIIKNNSFVNKMYVFLGSLFFKFIGMFVKVDKNLILFSSFGGDGFNDSPKAIYEALVNKFGDNFVYVWVFTSENCLKYSTLKSVKIDTWKYFVTSLKAKFWITNVNIERGLHFKKRKTVYINTWHGLAIKTIGNAVSGRNDYSFAKVDYLCSDSPYMTDIFINHFKAKKSAIYEYGRPREDYLIQNIDSIYIKNRVKEKLGIKKDKKIILYAPTFRDYKNIDSKAIVDIELDKMIQKLGSNFIILYRGHHFTCESKKLVFGTQIKNVSSYDSINDLYLISDFLISDFSSCFFDFYLLKKPMLCFATDYEEYSKKRGLFINLEKEFPNGVVFTLDHLLDILRDYFYAGKFDWETYYNFFNKYVANRDTFNATLKIVEYIERQSK